MHIPKHHARQHPQASPNWPRPGVLGASAHVEGQGTLHHVTEACAGGQVWADVPLEGMPFGMTHATARSEARGIKIGLCKRAERKLLPEIWDICHLTPGPGTIHSWAICVSALQEKQARSYSLAALPLPTRSFPGTKSNYTSRRGRAKNRSKCILDGTACHQEWGGFSFSFLFLT